MSEPDLGGGAEEAQAWFRKRKRTGKVKSLGTSDPNSFPYRELPYITSMRYLDEGRFLLPFSLTECVYQPRTEATLDVYEGMLGVIQDLLGWQPLSILSGAAVEILAVLKNEMFRDYEKRGEIERFLRRSISEELFNDLVRIGKLITDFPCEVIPVKLRVGNENLAEEILMRAPMPTPFDANENNLVMISGMPEWARYAFNGMTKLNRVESVVYEAALFANENILLCAPTGAGQTNVAILTILQQFSVNMNRVTGSINHNGYKIVYMAPVRAVAQVVHNLSNRLGVYGLRVREMTGHDQTLTRQQIEGTHIIVTTPEDWDIITRKFGDHTCTRLVTLIIIDGVHLLDGNTGPALESIVARAVRLTETTKKPIRLVGLSATFPNYRDVGLFLRVDKGLFYFNNSYRPVPLSHRCIGIRARNPLWGFHFMNELCYKRVMAVGGKRQLLIFVHSENETARTACAIRDTARSNNTLKVFVKPSSRPAIEDAITHVQSNYLIDLLPNGFAILHAGLSENDRNVVENLFTHGHVQVLVSTSTLAWGLSLRAHTVIIKGTRVYDPEKGAWTELSPLDVMQMLGHAKRPTDSFGEGIIITEHERLDYYCSLLDQRLPIESRFLSKLVDQLNAEIVLGTVQNYREACNWLRYTYLSARMRLNPTRYHLEADHLQRDIRSETKLAEMIDSAVIILDSTNLVKYDKESGFLQVTDLGRITSYHYIAHRTISTYDKNLKQTMGYIKLCRLFSLSEEFKYITVQQGEKLELAKLLVRMPIQVKESLEEPSAKINVLLQACISQLPLEGLSLTSDVVYISQCAGRLLRALFEIVLKRGWAQLTIEALNLCIMFNKRKWIEDFDLSSQEPEEFIGPRPPEFGTTLHPELKLEASVQPITCNALWFELTITPVFQWEDNHHGSVEPFWVIVENNDQEYILHHEYFLLKKQYIDKVHTLHFSVPIHEPLQPQCIIRVVSDRWLGSQTLIPVSLGHLILREKYPPPTQLLNSQCLPVTVLRNPSYQALYDFTHFNRVQTQVFTALYNSDDNVLVAAPTGSGKSICAEFAILRIHREGFDRGMRVVYIAPIEDLAKERRTDWQKKFGRSDGLNLCVVELTGNTVTDLKLFEKGHIIISTPEKWYALSRRWKKWQLVQKVDLFIIDEVHLIGGQGGPIIDIIVSRMRYIASQVKNQIRIVAVSTSLANARDLGEWIGATFDGIFNFPPGVCPVEINIQGVDLANFEAMFHALVKSTYSAIVQHGKPALVYVPTRKHVQLTALDLVAYSDADSGGGPPFSLRRASIGNINDKILGRTLRHGVGYLHEDLCSYDQNTVSELFKASHIQVCVMSGSMCWKVPLSAHVVVVMGTQYTDDQENILFEYPVTDVLQMMDHASLPGLGNSRKCVIFCHAPRQAYCKTFLRGALPVESHLHQFLHDNLSAEVVAEIIKNKQDAVDYLERTFLYRRLTQNPNYYNLQGVTPKHLFDYLSKLVENTLNDLEKRGFVSIKDGKDYLPLNYGRIASHHCISYATIEHFSSSLTSQTNRNGLLQILTYASEYLQLPIRPGEEEMPKGTKPHVKAYDLLQAHLVRTNVAGNLVLDQREVLLLARRLLPAMVDVISSKGWLNLALLAMEVSQMVTRGMCNCDSMLLQIPHFTKELAKRCKENPGKSIKTVSDLVDMKNDERRELLDGQFKMSKIQLEDIEKYCKRFPYIEMISEVLDSENVRANKIITLQVDLDHGRVRVPRYPKDEWLWLVVGDAMNNSLVAIERVTMQTEATVNLTFVAPTVAGRKTYTLYLKYDSYLGCDKEHSFTVDVKGE